MNHCNNAKVMMIGKDDDNLINTDDASHVVSIETNERRTRSIVDLSHPNTWNSTPSFQAITQHPKVSGPKYPAVVYLVVTQHYTMTQRNLINTPIAREKIPVTQINPSGAVTFAVKNDRDRR